MKKIILILLAVIFVLSLTACGLPASEDPYTDHDKMLNVVNNFHIESSNGCNYALEQRYKGTLVNTHRISLMFSDGVGSRTEYLKSLNENMKAGQFTETTVTAYYQNGKILTPENGKYVSHDGSFEDFAKMNIGPFNLRFKDMENVNLTVGDEAVLTFTAPDSVAEELLGISGGVKDLSFKIVTDPGFTRLLSLVMRYSQEKTDTVFTFTPYYCSVNIVLPE